MADEKQDGGIQEGQSQQSLYPQEQYPQWPYMQQPGQQYPGQQYPGQQDVTQKPEESIAAIVGFILALFGFLMILMPVFVPLGLYLSIAACILCAVGMRKGRRGLAIAGLIVSLANIVVIAVFFTGFFA